MCGFLLFFFLLEKETFEQRTVFTAPVYYSSMRLLPSTNVSKICTFGAKMTSKVILINMNVFKQNKQTKTTKTKSATAAAKCSLFCLISYAKAELCWFPSSRTLCFLKSGENTLFSVSFYFTLSIPSPCKHISPCPAISKHFQSCEKSLSFFQFYILTYPNLNMFTYI